MVGYEVLTIPDDRFRVLHSGSMCQLELQTDWPKLQRATSFIQ